jgi:hypothetical protein
MEIARPDGFVAKLIYAQGRIGGDLFVCSLFGPNRIHNLY